MKSFIIILLLLTVSTNCLAFQSPLDSAGDKIRKNTNDAVDDSISKMKIAANQAQQDMKNGIKNFLKWLLGELLSIFTILAVGYTFTYLVPKSTGKMMLIVTILCGLNRFLQLFL